MISLALQESLHKKSPYNVVRLILGKVKDKKNVVPHLGQNEPEDMQVLDVSQLHALLFRHILKIDTREKYGQQYVPYKVNSEEAMGMVDRDEYDVAFFMNPNLIEHATGRLAEKGVRLPQ